MDATVLDDTPLESEPPTTPSSAPRRSWVDDPRNRQIAYGVAAFLAFLAVQRFFWPAPIGILVRGVVIGGLTSLIAFGVALIYRSNRIINFAQGDLGGVPASLGALLVIGSGVPYLLALPIALAAAVAIGIVVEVLFIRRFAKAPRLILTVVTIGLSQILAGFATALPQGFDLKSPQIVVPAPVNIDFAIGQVIFGANELIAMAVVPIAIFALFAFFRYTSIGIAVRASAESADRAALLGVPVQRIQTIVWVIATVLATVAIFMRAGIIGLPIGSVLGPTLLVRSLAACVVGRMEKLSWIFMASVALGIIETTILFSTGRSLLVDLVLFLVILGALLFQRGGSKNRVGDDASSSWQAARPVRPIPRELAKLPEVIWGIRGLSGAFALFLVILPALIGEGSINLAGLVLISAMVGVSLVVLTGWAGQVSIGQFAFVGVGAAVGGYLSLTRGWDLILSSLGAGLAGALVAVLIGLPALRIPGLFLSVITVSFALATSSYFLNPEFIHWLPVDRIERSPLLGRIAIDTEDRYYYVCLAAFGLSVAMARGLRRSRTGRVLIGVRENARGAQAYGVSPTSSKLIGFAISGFLAAFAGAILVHHQQSLGISTYSVQASRLAFTQVVIGGLGSVPGAVIGATLIQGVEYVRTSLPSAIQPFTVLLTSGFGLVLVLLFLPGGFSQLFYNMRDRLLRAIADRRGLVVASMVADQATSAATPAAAKREAPIPAEATVTIEDMATFAPEELPVTLPPPEDLPQRDDAPHGDAPTAPRRVPRRAAGREKATT